MANLLEVEAQVRFALSQLPAQNAHHDFEHICRHLTQQFICSNVLPATGPVSAGGDQGRDFETFRTYLREELGPHGAFLGLVSEGTIAFICTTQADGLLAKLRQDIAKVCASGHLVHEIRAFTLAAVPVGTRHQLETETQESRGVQLEFHDAESIANLLAMPEGFWIAERFLSIPAEIRPEPVAIDGDLSAEYVERRRRWREQSQPIPTLGDFIDLKSGLREAAFQQEARSDLPFWLGLVRQVLAHPECPARIQQRARYELVVATFRGMREFRSVDDLARVYLEEALNESEPARLLDASALLMYANTAAQWGVTSLTPNELGDWNARLTTRAQDLVTQETSETPHRRANLLYAIGHLGLQPALWEADVKNFVSEAYAQGHQDPGAELPNPGEISLPDGHFFADVSLTFSAWSEIMDNLEETPLFPVESMADILQLLLPLWSRHAQWRALLDAVDGALGERSGRHTIGARARDRAVKLLEARRCLDALEEFHQAKVEWWSGETVRGSLLAMILIAELYFELRLPQASKSYALAVSYIAASRGDEDLADLVPAGLLQAAGADFIAGAWCSAAELYELGLRTQYEFVEDGTDFEKHPAIQNALLHLSYVRACAEIVDPDLASLIGAMTARIGEEEFIEGVASVLNSKDEDYWESFGTTGLVARPFADLGAVRCIRFSALGTDWTLVAANDIDSIRVAERFAAAAQVMLAGLAREDLCMIQTQINVRIETVRGVQTPGAERIESLPSNNSREWVVRLTPVRSSDDTNFKEMGTQLSAMIAMILREVSLLPEVDFYANFERAFGKGLGHKLSSGRPYDELAAAFAADSEPAIQRYQINTPWDCREGSFEAHDELRWKDGPGPTYSGDQANELLQTRYQNLAKGLRITIPMLASSEEFRLTAEALRAKGWLDWHIMAAIFNIVMNYRFPVGRDDLPLEDAKSEMMRAAFRQESATADPVPIGLFTLDAMDENRQRAVLPLMKHWGLELQQKTPDIPAIEQLLADRYGYWDNDVPHEDPFPETGIEGNNGGIVVVEDVPPEPQA